MDPALTPKRKVSGDAPGSGGKKSRKRDPVDISRFKRPRRPPTAFLIFMEEYKTLALGREPESDVGVIVKDALAKWKSFFDLAKSPYKMEYERRKGAYNVALAKFTKIRMIAGEDENWNPEAPKPKSEEAENPKSESGDGTSKEAQ